MMWEVSTGLRDSDTVWLQNHKRKIYLSTDPHPEVIQELERIASLLNWLERAPDDTR